ncbi:MAG: ABC transporter permease subunit [Gaiellaceae bacterium]
MLGNVFAKTLRERRRGFLWWTIGLVAFAAMYSAVFPSVRGNNSLNKLVQAYPQALKGFIGFGGNLDISSGAGYLGSEVFSLVAPLIFLAMAIGAGAAAIAGEEERGTLDLLLSLPLTRSACLLQKLAALVCEVLALGLALWIALAILAPATGMHVSTMHLAAAVLDLVLLTLVFGTLALAIGAASGRRALSIGLAAALAVAAYVIAALAPLASWLDRVKLISPYYYYSHGDPLRHGLDLTDTIVLAAAALVIAVVCPFVFRRRDLATS